ncbi:hypothetical protein Tco_0269776 [Tanacetum coccineum]
MSEPMPSIPTQSPFTYPNPSALPSFTQDDTSDSFIPEPTQPIPIYTQPACSQPAFSQPNQSFFSQPAIHLTQPSQTNPNNVQPQQEYMKGSVNVDKTKNESNKRKFDGSHKNVENTIIDDCLNVKDLTLSLMGRVKEMASLVNLKKALCNKGFDMVKISYLEELWVLLELETAKAKDSFRGNVGVTTHSGKEAETS